MMYLLLCLAPVLVFLFGVAVVSLVKGISRSKAPKTKV